MSKRENSKYKIDRRLRVNLWGRPKSPINKREYGPGQHGQGRQKPTDYRLQLMAKQRLKGYYGSVSERQLRRYYLEAVRRKSLESKEIRRFPSFLPLRRGVSVPRRRARSRSGPPHG